MKRKVLIVIFYIGTFGIGLGVGAVAVANVLTNIIEEYRKSSDKFSGMFQCMRQWVRLKQEGKSIYDYFEKNNYREIAVYGKGYIGEILAKELLESTVTIKYFIDQKADKDSDGFMVSPDNELEEVDVVVVTPVTSYGEIKRRLIKKVKCPVISIEDILYEV